MTIMAFCDTTIGFFPIKWDIFCEKDYSNLQQMV